MLHEHKTECLICKSSDIGIFYKLRFNSNSNLYNCRNCKFYFLDRLEKPFDEDSYTYYKRFKDLEITEVYNQLNEKRYKKILDSFERKINKKNLPKTILDVGCGTGNFVHYANQNGWSASGIDLSKQAILIAKNFEKNCFNISLKQQVKINKKFSLVTSFELIEHLEDPENALRIISEITEKNGFNYHTTPNFDSLDRRLLKEEWSTIVPSHLNYFNLNSIKKILKNINGLDLINYSSQDISIFELVNHFFKAKDSENKIIENTSSHHLSDKNLRNKIEVSHFLKLTKKLINFFVNFLNLGRTSVIILKKN